ncbi:hypothetical protein HF850_08565 [Clostridium sp. SM-530-WT-3G]|nr:hypothetical protein [Clostridium sp. SM-530-WT-3G]
MYVTDDEMRNNINNVGGKGTAEFVSSAIVIYIENLYKNTH